MTNKIMPEMIKARTELVLKYPFFGNRQIAAYLPRSGCWAGRHRVRRLTGIMGLQAIYKRPNTAKKHRQEAPPAQNLAPLAEKTANHAPQSCLVQRHYLHSSEERLLVSGDNHGLGNTQSAVLAAVKYVGCLKRYIAREVFNIIAQRHKQITQAQIAA